MRGDGPVTVAGEPPEFVLAPGEVGEAALVLESERPAAVTVRSGSAWLSASPELATVDPIARITLRAEGPRAPAGYRREGTVLVSWGGGGRLVRISLRVVAPSERAVSLAAEGVALARAGRLGDAADPLERSLAFAPIADAHVALGYLALQHGRLAEARHYLQAARQLSPHDAEISHWLGVLCLEEDAPEEAERHLRAAVKQARRQAAGWRFASAEASRAALDLAREQEGARRLWAGRRSRWRAPPPAGSVLVAVLIAAGLGAMALPPTAAPPPAMPLPADDAAADAAEQGMLRVAADPPGASVLVDGRPAGRAPARIVVPAGSHRVTAQAEGLAPQTREVAVEGGHTTEVEISLRPRAATLRIASEPSGARVTVGGQMRGRTPLDLALPPGTARVVVERDGVRWSGAVPLAAGQARTVLVTLPRPGLTRVDRPPPVAAQPGPGAFSDGLRLLDQGWTGPAIARLREAVRADPRHAPSRYYLGIALARAGRYAEARAAFTLVQRLARGAPLAAEAARMLAALPP